MARGRSNDYLFQPKKKHPVRSFFLSLLFLVAAVALAVTAANLVVNSSLRQTTLRVTIADLPSDLENFSILHLSDLHGARLGSGQSAIGRAITGNAYSCAVLTGDMVGASGDSQPLMDLLSVIPRGTPVLLLPGDEDPPYLDEFAHSSLSPYAPWAEAAVMAGAVLLDEPYLMTYGKNGRSRIWLIPEDLYSLDIGNLAAVYQAQYAELSQRASITADDAARMRVAEYQIARAQRIQAALADMKDTDVQIAVSHAPLSQAYVSAFSLANRNTGIFQLRNAALILSGHYCGGQWRVPGKGPLYAPDLGWWPEDSLVSGLNYVYGIPQYISRGLGASSLYPWWERVRLFNPPDITRIVLSARLS